MGGMPYHLEKGPIFATLEAKYNGDRTELHQFLQRLWEGQTLGSHGVLTSSMYDGPSGVVNAEGEERKQSMFESWFGDLAPGVPQRAWGWYPDENEFVATTGYWFQYYGNVREIVRQTLLRAGEITLGFQRPAAGQPLPQGNRHWRVDFFWKCGQPRFEGWVTWRSTDPVSTTGHAVVIFATPATPDTVLARPGDEGHAVGTTPLQDHMKWQGMWVCTHENHRQYRILPSQPSGVGNWLVPRHAVMYTRGLGNVGTWVPEFGKGGTPDSESPFVPGPPGGP